MEFDRYYVVILKKGPAWTPDDTAELEVLQQRHQNHLTMMAEMGKLLISGPLEAHTNPDLRGISIFGFEAFASLDELKMLVEQDPMFLVGRLAADYLTWYVPKGAGLQP